MSTYRTGVKLFIPLFARATIVNIRSHLPPDPPAPLLDRLLASISQTDYAKSWSQYHHKPNLEDHLLGIVIHLIPKIGILRILAVKPPSSSTENLFVKSLDDALTRYRTLLASLSKSPSAELVLANLDLDTGARVVPGAYKLTDQATRNCSIR